MSHDAYEKTQRQSGNFRDAEYRAFAKTTRALIAAAETGRTDLKGLTEALHLNRMLWSALAEDCAKENDALPEETRARIIGLSRWVGSYSSEILRKGEDVEPLIDINRIMMDGLAGKAAN